MSAPNILQIAVRYLYSIVNRNILTNNDALRIPQRQLANDRWLQNRSKHTNINLKTSEY